VFTVLLPASEDARRSETPTPALATRAAAGSGIILFVDDEPALRTLAQRTLEQHGYGVLLAENGQQAIDILAAHPEVSAVVLDLAMPVMSGDGAGPIMHALRPDVPLILSSGYSEGGALERVGQGVVAAFLEKPYQFSVLVATLEEVLRGSPVGQGSGSRSC
jgi:CheY-like chemotaxis protein